jgi:uncharacterized protein
MRSALLGMVLAAGALLPAAGRAGEADSAGKLREALTLALGRQEVQAIKELVRQGADVNTRSKRGDTALIWASAWGDAAFARDLLDRGADVNQANERRVTPLMVAAGWNHAGVARLLLERGARVDVADAGGLTPLMYAAEGTRSRKRRVGGKQVTVHSPGRKATLALLLARGAPMHAADAQGRTALELARKSGDTAAVRVLQQAGAR